MLLVVCAVFGGWRTAQAPTRIFLAGGRPLLSFRILSKNLPEIRAVRGGFLLNILKFDRVPEHVTVRPALNRKY